MNRTVGVAVLISGVFFGLCGLLHLSGADGIPLSKSLDLDTALFLGGGFTLLVCGLLLLMDVHLAPPGSLMVRRGQA